ncbi:MAG: IclR family transcriptional regulator [Burkholderiaceae bacterium]
MIVNLFSTFMRKKSSVNMSVIQPPATAADALETAAHRRGAHCAATAAMADDPERYIVPALRRGLALLRLFSRHQRVLTLPQIVRELGVPRATAFRLAYTLEADGYLQRTPHSNAFQLGVNAVSLGFEYLGSLDLVDIGRPILEGLRDRLDVSVHMGVLDGAEGVCILSAPSQHRLRSNVSAGSRMAAHAYSIGRAAMLDETLDGLRKRFDGVKMQRFSDQTPTTVDRLYAFLQDERKKGYVSWRSANVPGIATVAAPVRDQTGCIVAGINVSDYESLPAMQDQDGKLKDELLHAAAEISKSLGYRAEATSARK